jgi:hypothetical protein
MTLTEYRQLPSVVKEIATQYWLAVILERMKLDNPNQLSKAINKSNSKLRGSCSPSFLYRKLKGSPIENGSKIELFDNLVPGSSNCLTNPLWQLFSNRCIDQNFIYKMLCELDRHVTSCLFYPRNDMALPNRKEKVTNEHIKKIERFNHPDALTCLLLLSLEQRALLFQLEASAYRVFTKLVSFTPLGIITDKLYTLIYFNFFPKSASELKENELADLNRFKVNLSEEGEQLHFKKYFSPIDESYWKKLTRFYQATADEAISANIIDNTIEQRMLFTNMLDKTDRVWVKIGLQGLINDQLEDRSNNCLPKLTKTMKYVIRTQ